MTDSSFNLFDALAKLDMTVESKPTEGLFFVKELGTGLDPRIHLHLENAKNYGATAVYFRMFTDDRSPRPQIFIYDYTYRSVEETETAHLHTRLWNAGIVPLFYIITKTDVSIFNCFKKPDFDEATNSPAYSVFETIKLASQIDSCFSAKRFDNGSFWEDRRFSKSFKRSDSAYESLLTHLKAVRDRVVAEKILPEKTANKLLVTSILIKYLEERKDQYGNKVFPDDFFQQFSTSGANSFVELLHEQGSCLKLFDYLSGHFNGRVFLWKDEEEKDKKERQDVENADLVRFADFLEAKTDAQGQGLLWRDYSFNDLPIELISNIYEEFHASKKKNGAVYTPPHLVNFLLDEAMPLHQPKSDFRVFDPSCGSGIFLVSAFKRLVEWWRIQNNWQEPDLTVLKNLLKDNIYGCDIDENAIQVALFSLSLALCDELAPKVIWEELRFDDLTKKNLLAGDFFKRLNSESIKVKFDLVIGNPPFKSELTSEAVIADNAMKSERPPIADKQIALLFMDQAITMCKESGAFCMIQPAAPFLYNKNSSIFRSYFLQKYNVPQIVDFTALEGVLFGGANVATIAVFAENKPSENNPLQHLTVRRTMPVKEKLFFELDKYDFHNVPFQMAINNRYIWKTNFLGGGRLVNFVDRFASLRTLGEFLENKEKNNKWKVNEGFILGNKSKVAEFLTNKPTLPTNALTEVGIDYSKVELLEEEYFERARTRCSEIYSSPHLLIKEKFGKNSIPIAFSNEYLTFRNEILGIHAPDNEKEELLKIERTIKNNRLFLFFVAALSGRFMISRATALLKSDLLSLPYPENLDCLDLSLSEQLLVDEVLDYVVEFRSRGENSKAVKPVTDAILNKFGNTYCSILNSVYEEFHASQPIECESFICYPFYYGKEPAINLHELTSMEAETHLDDLLHKDFGRSLRVNRVLRVYENNVIYLIKPKQIRYWLESIAMRDADETFADLMKQGY